MALPLSSILRCCYDDDDDDMEVSLKKTIWKESKSQLTSSTDTVDWLSNLETIPTGCKNGELQAVFQPYIYFKAYNSESGVVPFYILV